uniref:Uncharacterized protein n=1 Tax=Cacopsylla melanoneura TaxID=428564 RepID=A0A8D8QUI7_9HEMI
MVTMHSSILSVFYIQFLYLDVVQSFNVLSMFSAKLNADNVMTMDEDFNKNHWTNNRRAKIAHHYLKDKKKHDVIGKNITLVLNNLLKNYQSSEPPNYRKGLFDGLLFPSILEGLAIKFHGTYQQFKFEHQNARENLATRYVYFEWKTVVCPHNYSS